MMKRANYFELAPDALQILMNQEGYLRKQFEASGYISVSVWELVKLRVSQINQCAFCIDMHSDDARRQGESSEKLIGLSAWRDMPIYSKVERAALGWAELVLSGQSIDDAAYEAAVEILGEQGVVDLTIAVNAINSWNRIAKTFNTKVGSYKS